MTFRLYILFMCIATVLSWLAWGLVLWNVDPDQAGLMSLIIFYLTLGLSLIGTLTLAGIIVRVIILGRADILSREVRISFRHAVFLSVAGIFSLLLSAQENFKWWTLLVLLAVVGAVEYMFVLRDVSRRN